MQQDNDHQELVDFFTGRPLPAGPQHLNPYSVFLDLNGAVVSHLHRLGSEVEATRRSSALTLTEVKKWLLSQAP